MNPSDEKLKDANPKNGRLKSNQKDWSRRGFLQTVGAGVPTLTMLLGESAAGAASPLESGTASGKFTTLDLGRFFNSSAKDFGPREHAQRFSKGGLIPTSGGDQNFRGIPFRLGPEGVEKKSWVVLGSRTGSATAKRVTVPVGKRADFVCLSSFCDWDPNEFLARDEDKIEQVGQKLAQLVLVYEDGSEEQLPIRRRFEVQAPTFTWGHRPFTALPHGENGPLDLRDPLEHATQWGGHQTVIGWGTGSSGPPYLWVCAPANPQPKKVIKELRFESTSEDPWVLCALTLFHGSANPLRYERLSLYRLTLPDAVGNKDRWKLDADLGVVARTYTLGEFTPETWLTAKVKGMGETVKPTPGDRRLFVEITASKEAVLTLTDTKTGTRYTFDLGEVQPGKELEAKPQGARVEILESQKTWLHGQTVDTADGRPTPVRLSFRSKDGRYIPPYGHRADINSAWFQDYGADLKMQDSSFAYVDGKFQVELPTGDVYVEMTKGFEYEPVRRKLHIKPGQRDLKLEISRITDLRSKGWVTADTHVHFLSPSTAVLEGQAEGLNLVNLLVAQWGDLFTNVGDLSHGALTSPDGETVVQVSTENRQHILGHLALLGGHGDPVFPMSASGPSESYLGTPLWTGMSGWADQVHERGGLASAVHFPYPTAEMAAEIVLGKVDAVELMPHGEHFSTLRFLDWYRYLNCGYRLPAVGGTDKMSAYMPVGATRTYAHLGQDEYNFKNWAKAVRRGNTFMSSGPLLDFRVDGKAPGAEIALGANGGTVEVKAEATCHVPFERLEVVLNGKIVACKEDKNGTRRMTLTEKIPLSGPGWLAARCASHPDVRVLPGIKVQAHTSPVYVTAPGKELFSPPAAAYFLTLIEGSEAWIKNLATRPDPEQLAHILKAFTEAKERLHRKMHEHGVHHH